MNSNLAFADAARPRPVVILRLLMREYSIGHELLLTQQRNPIIGDFDAFAQLPVDAQCFWLARAVWTCARNWEGNRVQESPFKMWRWKRSVRGDNWFQEMTTFAQYRDAGSTFPEIISPDSAGRTLGSPYLARLLAFCGDMDCPLGLAQWKYFAHAETEGSVKIANDDERQTESEVDALRAEYIKEKAEKTKEGQCPP